MLEDNDWGISWRGAGSVVSTLRNQVYGTTEDYMNYYCSGMGSPIDGIVSEGTVTKEIEGDLRSIGWLVKKKYRTME